MKDIQLIVNYRDNSTGYYPLKQRGWRIDTAHRQLVIGRGLHRVMIPFDNVWSYTLDEYEVRDGSETNGD